ncbi:uncharacterized protein P884DRAFT_281257 [Thermothelomyces heterothallicus CBS 202.75]|uniref:uncharacterized protein n=1 Tax=Thermothelomyces heterothallicus CBS 202.75 TaxID=1149848 RepID=UPI003743EB99
MAQPSDGPEAALLDLLHISRSGANRVGNLLLNTTNWVQAALGTTPAPPAPAEAIEDGWEVVVDDGTLSGSDDTSDLEDRYDDNGGLFDGEPITGGYTFAECLSDYGSSVDESAVDSSSGDEGGFGNRWEPPGNEGFRRIVMSDGGGSGKPSEGGGSDDEVQSSRNSRCSSHPKLDDDGVQPQTDANLSCEDGDESDSDNDVYVDARSHVESEHLSQDHAPMANATSEPQSSKPLESHQVPVAGCKFYAKLEAMLRARVAALWEKALAAQKAAMVAESGVEARPGSAPTVTAQSRKRMGVLNRGQDLSASSPAAGGALPLRAGVWSSRAKSLGPTARGACWSRRPGNRPRRSRLADPSEPPERASFCADHGLGGTAGRRSQWHQIEEATVKNRGREFGVGVMDDERRRRTNGPWWGPPEPYIAPETTIGKSAGSRQSRFPVANGRKSASPMPRDRSQP